MHLVWFTLGLGAGDEVIVPAQTHTATAHAVELTGAKAVFVDVEPKAIQTINKNLEGTRLKDKAEVRQTDAFLYLRKTEKQFDFIFIAPPQYKSLWIEALHTVAERPQLLKPEGMIIVQIDPSEFEPIELTDFIETESRSYGNTQILFFARKS
jgi:16S rRNA G966 N2-methylase RsmD